MMQKTFIKSELPEIARDILSRAISSFSSSATVVSLSGDLGAGKTTLTQALAKELGIKENIISPTFVIIKNYQLLITNYKWKNLIHIDAYRLNKSEELLKLGWVELVANKDNLIIIEWPEQVPECIPQNALKANISHLNEETREIKIML